MSSFRISRKGKRVLLALLISVDAMPLRPLAEFANVDINTTFDFINVLWDKKLVGSEARDRVVVYWLTSIGKVFALEHFKMHLPRRKQPEESTIEHATEYEDGSMLIWATTNDIYPVDKRIAHAQRLGHTVWNRRVRVLRDWEAVPSVGSD